MVNYAKGILFSALVLFVLRANSSDAHSSHSYRSHEDLEFLDNIYHTYSPHGRAEVIHSHLHPKIQDAGAANSQESDSEPEVGNKGSGKRMARNTKHKHKEKLGDASLVPELLRDTAKEIVSQATKEHTKEFEKKRRLRKKEFKKAEHNLRSVLLDHPGSPKDPKNPPDPSTIEGKGDVPKGIPEVADEEELKPDARRDGKKKKMSAGGSTLDWHEKSQEELHAASAGKSYESSSHVVKSEVKSEVLKPEVKPEVLKPASAVKKPAESPGGDFGAAMGIGAMKCNGCSLNVGAAKMFA